MAADQPGDSPGNRFGTGDGDNYDPEVHGMDDADLAATTGASRPADGSGGQGGPGHGEGNGDGDERASEIDDVTSGISRDDLGSALDGEAALADAVDEAMAPGSVDVDYSNVDVATLLAEREEFKSLAQRVQADFNNFRKQSALRARQDADRATGRLAEALLPVLDAAEAAFLRHPEEVGPLLNQMLIELKKHGLESIDLDGQPFDPEVAEAVAHEPGDGGEPVVAEVLRSGYRWKEKTLRPAMVKTKD